MCIRASRFADDNCRRSCRAPPFVGFGNSAQSLTLLGSTIDLTNASGTLSNFAFQVPRAGVITSFSAYFSLGTVNK